MVGVPAEIDGAPLELNGRRAHSAVLVMRKVCRLFKIGTGYPAHSLRQVLHWLPYMVYAGRLPKVRV